MCQTLQSGILGIIQRENTAPGKKTHIGEAAAWFGCIIATVARAVRGRKEVPGPRRNHKTNIVLPDAGNRRLNRRGEGMEATLFGITLPSTCWELGVKRFTYSTQFSRHRRVLAARKELSGALGAFGCFNGVVRDPPNLRSSGKLSGGIRAGCGARLESVVEKGLSDRAVRPRTGIQGSYGEGKTSLSVPITQRTRPSTCSFGRS